MPLIAQNIEDEYNPYNPPQGLQAFPELTLPKPLRVLDLSPPGTMLHHRHCAALKQAGNTTGYHLSLESETSV